MYALGNHLRVASVEQHLSAQDFGVVTTFEQECQSHSINRNPMMASLKYVGWIEEILKVNFGRFQTILFLG
jgi:hypothetical protein